MKWIDKDFKEASAEQTASSIAEHLQPSAQCEPPPLVGSWTRMPTTWSLANSDCTSTYTTNSHQVESSKGDER